MKVLSNVGIVTTCRITTIGKNHPAGSETNLELFSPNPRLPILEVQGDHEPLGGVAVDVGGRGSGESDLQLKTKLCKTHSSLPRL